jgi:hypothetical protein
MEFGTISQKRNKGRKRRKSGVRIQNTGISEL